MSATGMDNVLALLRHELVSFIQAIDILCFGFFTLYCLGSDSPVSLPASLSLPVTLLI